MAWNLSVEPWLAHSAELLCYAGRFVRDVASMPLDRECV